MKKFLKKVQKQFRYGEKGFTLIELLVVVAILGVLAAVAVPNVGKFIGKGKTEALETELHNVQTGVMAMLADSSTGVLDGYSKDTPLATIYQGVDMSQVTSTNKIGGDLKLSDYLTGLDAGVTKAAGAQDKVYKFIGDGTVTQIDKP